MKDKNKVLEIIAADMERDAKEYDGKPFTGRNVAEYFGKHGAAIAGLAKIMRSKEQGQVLELDPTKEYWMFIKIGTPLWKATKAGYLRKMKTGRILFAGELDEFRFVEHSDKIKGIVFEEEE